MNPRARSANVHATCVRLGRAGDAFGAPVSAGILLLGESGSGKSDVALRLIQAGATLVADDRVELFVSGRRLCARPPARIAGLLEIRGVGIVDTPYTDKVEVMLAVALGRRPARLPVHGRYVPPRPLALPASARPPLVRIAAFETSAAAKIAAAAAAFAQGLFRDEVKPS